MMQELLAGVEKIRFDSEADAEQQRGARPLPFPGVDRSPRHGFLHDYDAARVPECHFYSKFGSGLEQVADATSCLREEVPLSPGQGECSNKDCRLLHVDATASTVGCPWYDRGFCRRGPLCKYKHTRRVMCSNYLVGFCPEGPKCKFVHLKAGLMTSSTDPSKEAGCPLGLLQRDLAAREERGGEDVPPKESPPRVTQHLAAHLWDTNGCPPSPQSLLEGGTCSKSGSVSPCR